MQTFLALRSAYLKRSVRVIVPVEDSTFLVSLTSS